MNSKNRNRSSVLSSFSPCSEITNSQSADKQVLRVAAAIIVHRGTIFAARRASGKQYDGWWEFPGGKIEAGESAQQCCIREIKEELNIDIDIGEHFYTVDFAYPEFHLHMECFLCSPVSSLEDIELSQHNDYRWLTRDDLYEPKWLPAAFGPLKKLESQDFWSNTPSLENEGE